MARMIDTDALRLMKVEECAGHPIEYAMGWKACIEWIKDVPTIDAIPVEWIKNRLDAMLKGTASAESCFAVQIMLIDWQKEQEER